VKSARIWVIAFVVIALVGGVALMRNRSGAKPALQLYTWSNYFPDELIAEFTQATGTEVVVSYFSSNEELFAKMVAGASGYDLILPSDYMVSRMIARQMLLPLDANKVPNLKLIDEYFRNLPYDKGLTHSVPFGRGHTGIVVNTEKVQLPPGEVSWDLIFNSPDSKHTSLLDDVREVFAMGLMLQGFAANSHVPAELTQVSEELKKAKKQIALFSSEPVPLLLKGELHIAHAFSTHAMQVESENKAFKFFYPKEGAVTWTDNFAIPKGARHAEQAHQFINFFLEPARAAKCAQTSGLATPSEAARKLLPDELRQNPILYPDKKTNERLFFLDDMSGESLMLINRLWTEMKSS
jgi:spermidine/putrescine transport system substrate-binding protein